MSNVLGILGPSVLYESSQDVWLQGLFTRRINVMQIQVLVTILYWINSIFLSFLFFLVWLLLCNREISTRDIQGNFSGKEVKFCLISYSRMKQGNFGGIFPKGRLRAWHPFLACLVRNLKRHKRKKGKVPILFSNSKIFHCVYFFSFFKTGRN